MTTLGGLMDMDSVEMSGDEGLQIPTGMENMF